MPSLPVDNSDIYSQFGVSSNDYFIDPITNTIKRKEFALPVEQPTFDAMGTPSPTNQAPDYTGINPIVGKLFGVGGNERYQTWPERMVRSGSTIAGDVASGEVPIQSPTGYPGSVLPVEQPMEPNIVGKALGIGNFTVPSSNSEIGRAQDLAGMAGMSSIPLAEKGALGAIGGKFYSTLENTIANSKVQKATPEQWQSYLKNQPGVKPEELEFSLSNLPEGQITKDQLAAHVADNGIKLGENSSPTYQGNINNYSQWQLPGGSNYREQLLTIPEKTLSPELAAKNYYENFARKGDWPTWENLDPAAKKSYYELVKENNYNKNTTETYRSSHWDEPNVLAHIRMNDREVPGVGKTLHVEEIQSDWHQAGRKQGYKSELEALNQKGNETLKRYEEAKKERDNLKGDETLEQINAVVNKVNALRDEVASLNSAYKAKQAAVPDAPFKKTWDELALKRVLSEAVNKGYDAVSWTPGEAQAARYDLSKQVKGIRWEPAIAAKDNSIVRIDPHEGSTISLQIDKTGKVVASQKGGQFEGKNLSDVVGKEIAEKIIGKDNGFLKDVDLKVGGEGMKAFYDKILVDKANALVKKMGGKVEYENLPGKFEVSDPRNNMVASFTSKNELNDWLKLMKIENDKRYKINEIAGTRAPIIKITPQMREQISQKGFSLYSSGVPVFTPVDHDPHKMTPIDYNPFTNSKAM